MNIITEAQTIDIIIAKLFRNKNIEDKLALEFFLFVHVCNS